MNHQKNNANIRKLVMCAILTAIVIILQLLGSFIRFGTFSVSLVLAPIVIGAALLGPFVGMWLGFVFGLVVLMSGDAGAFLAVDVAGTVITVLVKGSLAGLLTGLAYKAAEKINVYVATAISAVVCPVVNTGVFLVGCKLFFMDTITEWAGGSDAVASFSIGKLI